MRSNLGLHLIGCVALFVLVVILLVVSTYVTLDFMYFGIMTLVLGLLGLNVLSRAYNLLRAPIRVTVGEQCLRVEHRRATNEWTWEQIGGCIWRGDAVLIICQRTGRPLVKLPGILESLDELVDIVSYKIGEMNSHASSYFEAREKRKVSIGLALSSVFFIILGLAGMYDTHEELRGFQLLNEQGVQGMGQVESLRTAMIGPVKRVVYRVLSTNGKAATGDVIVDQKYWESLEVGSLLPIVYVPEAPRFSRLVRDEIKPPENPVKSYVVCTGLVLFGFFSFFQARRLWLRHCEESAAVNGG
ncbi:MAG: hypothetical protein K1Y02_25625 [Candidatus Hydrogenedentes bacterium]|nr:hypothetical protein [Candidatus Hydrogenedentota bacterium]